MTHTIYAYGNGEVLETLFNAIAGLLSHSQDGKSMKGSLYAVLLRLGLMTGFMGSIIALAFNQNYTKMMTTWFLPVYAMITLLFAPTTSVTIRDMATGNLGVVYKVDNVPWGLGAFAATVSTISYTLTQKVETAFSLPDDLQYHKTGAMMASHLIANARTFHITNLNVHETMKDFVHQCVVYSALLGTKYTLNDLKNSANIWKLVKDKASPARAFTFRDLTGKPTIMTCNKGVEELDKLLNVEVNNAFAWFSNTLYGTAQPNATQAKGVTSLASPNKASTNAASPIGQGPLLTSYMSSAYGYMANMASSAEDLMKQQMMIYTVMDSIESKSTALGNAQNFALRRAYLQQRANQENVAGMAQKTMIVLKNVMEALIYATFIFMLPLAMVPYGWRFIGNWASMVVWVQMWGPLYAIVNFIMNAAAKSKGLGVIMSSGGVTIANSVGFSDLHADMAAQAGYLSLSVGALAYALVKGGASGLSHLAGSMSGPLTAAAGRATEDMLSGNYSFGNISTGNVQASNQSFGQQLFSPSYSSGAFSQNDGMVASVISADGSRIVNIANSNLRSNLQWSENLSSTFSEQANQATTASQSSMKAWSEQEGVRRNTVLDFASHKAQQTSHGEGVSASEQVSANTTFTQLDRLMTQFADDNKISKDQACKMLGQVNLGIQGGLSLFGVGIKGDASGSAQWDDTDHNSKAWSKAQQLAKEASFQEAFNKTEQYSQDSRFNENDEKGQRLASSISSATEKAETYRHEAQAHLQQAQSYTRSAAWAKQNNTQISANLNQEFIEWLSQQSLPHSSGAMGQQEADTLLTARPQLLIPYQQRFLEEKVGSMRHDIETHAAGSTQHVEQAHHRHASALNTALTSYDHDIGQHAQQRGLTNEGTYSKIAAKGQDLRQQYEQNDAHMEQGMLSGRDLHIAQPVEDMKSVQKYDYDYKTAFNDRWGVYDETYKYNPQHETSTSADFLKQPQEPAIHIKAPKEEPMTDLSSIVRTPENTTEPPGSMSLNNPVIFPSQQNLQELKELNHQLEDIKDSLSVQGEHRFDAKTLGMKKKG